MPTFPSPSQPGNLLNPRRGAAAGVELWGYPSAGGTGTAQIGPNSPGFGPSVEFGESGRDGEGMSCSTLGLFPLPFAEVSDGLLCFPWAFTIFPRNLSPSLPAGSFSLPLCSSGAKISTLGCSVAKGKFPFPVCDRIADFCLCFGKIFLLPSQPKLCLCKTCSSSLPSPL